jgi:murein DD-endopeptidase MepM/ murein hydrolase activator NlpD
MSTRSFYLGLLLFAAGVVCGVAALWYSLGGLEHWHAARHASATSLAPASAVVVGPPSVAKSSPAHAPQEASTVEPKPSPPAQPPSPASLPAPQHQPKPESAPGHAPTQPLRALELIIPVQGFVAAQLQDVFTDARGEGRRHEAIDIMAALGTPVLAVEAGRIVKLFASKQGGLTVYQFDAQDELAYYYAHLDRYAEGLTEGQPVAQGEVIGYVGYSGNASPNAPHLHFAIFQLGTERRWWQGEAINPYPHLVRVLDATRAEGR